MSVIGDTKQIHTTINKTYDIRVYFTDFYSF